MSTSTSTGASEWPPPKRRHRNTVLMTETRTVMRRPFEAGKKMGYVLRILMLPITLLFVPVIFAFSLLMMFPVFFLLILLTGPVGVVAWATAAGMWTAHWTAGLVTGRSLGRVIPRRVPVTQERTVRRKIGGGGGGGGRGGDKG